MGRVLEIAGRTPYPDVTIQWALREIDTHQLATAMLGFDEQDREAIHRNMSKRAIVLLDEETEAQRGKTPEYSITEAMQFFEQKLTKYARHFTEDEKNTEVYRIHFARKSGSGEQPAKALAMPDFDMSSEAALFESFRNIKIFIQSEGVLALEGISEEIEHPVASKALRYVVDGWDPVVMRSMLERAKETYLDRQRRILDMVLEGADCLASANNMLALEERLSAFMV